MRIIVGMAFVLLATQANAQGVVSPVQTPPSGNAVLRVGTEVPLRLVQELTTKGKTLRVGDRFHLEASEPVLVNGNVVIPVALLSVK